MQRIVPMIAYEDAAAAIDWLTAAFGFVERPGQRFTDEDGTVVHAELERGGAVVMLATPNADYRNPKRRRETCEQARRWQDNPWVVDGLFVAGRRRRTPCAGCGGRGGGHPPARGQTTRPACGLHRRGPRGASLDVRPASRRPARRGRRLGSGR